MVIDVLNRDMFVEKVMNTVNTISESKKSCSFAIDGDWGAGKSFVLDMIKEKLCNFQNESTFENRYFIFNYNCWMYDYYEEPAIAVISAMLDTVEREMSAIGTTSDNIILSAWQVAKDNLIKISSKFVENRIGINLVDIYEDISNKKIETEEKKYEFDNLFAFKKTLDEARDILCKVSINKTVLIIVDELDRCIPSYSIKVLERLHHLFIDVPNIIVLFAIDSKQLEHSVKQIYGDGTSVEKYLKKFISFTMKLDYGKADKNLFNKYNTYFSKFSNTCTTDMDYVETVLLQVLEGIEIREQEKIFEKADLLHSIICSDIVDISLCVFEIMVMRYSQIWQRNLYWIPEINRGIYSDLERLISKNKVEFLKDLENKVGNGRLALEDSARKKILGESINDKVFWYFSKCYGRNEIYFNPNQRFSEQYSIAKKYCDFLDAIK